MLQQSYDAFPRVEEAFHAALSDSLQPRGPGLLYDLVRDFDLSPGSDAIDVGCGEGAHTIHLAENFALAVTGFDSVPRHIELASAQLAARVALHPELTGRVRFELGTAEALPLEDVTVDLIWCRDVLGHVANLDRAYAEFQRVLRAKGQILVYHMFATDRLERREANWLWRTMGLVPASADHVRTDAAIAAAGPRINDCIDLGSEWGEWAARTQGVSLIQEVLTPFSIQG